MDLGANYYAMLIISYYYTTIMDFNAIIWPRRWTDKPMAAAWNSGAILDNLLFFLDTLLERKYEIAAFYVQPLVLLRYFGDYGQPIAS